MDVRAFVVRKLQDTCDVWTRMYVVYMYIYIVEAESRQLSFLYESFNDQHALTALTVPFASTSYVDKNTCEFFNLSPGARNY